MGLGCLFCFTQFLCLLLFLLQFQATCSVTLSSNINSKPLCHHEQSHALLQFKNSFSIDSSASDGNPPYVLPYPKTDSWKEGTDCCLWDGVTCDLETGNIIELDLSCSMLYGTFHSNNSLFFLKNLQKLDLSDNDFNSSKISSRFGQFLNLTYLNLNYSVFYGQVPSEISHLSSLVSLDLSRNDLTLETDTFNKLVQNLTKLRQLSLNDVNMSMVAPTSFMNLSASLSSLRLGSCSLQRNFLEIVHLPTRLLSLDLSSNDFILDTISLNKFVGNLSNLREIDLSSVNMSSVALNSLMNLSSSLSFLKLRSSGLRGNFPDNIHLSKLVSLDLSFNSNLTIDTIAFNKLVKNLREVELSFVNMSLVAPSSLMNLSSSLSSLALRYCKLQGEFPGNILQRPYLQELDLWGNEDLTGSLPKSNWSSSLQVLYLSYTKIPIYVEPYFINNLRSLKILGLVSCNFIDSKNLALFGKLTQLNSLYLSYNNFSGQIPSSFENLKYLTSLYLSSNHFSGQIPSSLAQLKQLYYLNLSNNNLSGPIPSKLGSLPSLTSLDLSGNLLNASIPSSLFSLPNLEYLSLQNNQLLGRIGQFRSNSLYYIDLSYNKLHGPIPNSIFHLLKLSVLILSSNDKLTGEISPSVCKLQFLEILDLSNNSLTGFIPQCLGNFSNSLSVLHLGMNKFRGNIPSTFSKGNGLRYLNLNGNKLQGGIPLSTINCTNLEILDLGNNEIDDMFPHFLATLPELQILVLHFNKLRGSIKNSFTSNCSFPKLRVCDLSNNNLSGPLPTNYFDNFEGMIKIDQNMKYMGAKNFSYDYSVALTLKGLEIKLVRIQTIFTTIDLSSNKFTGDILWSIGKLKSLKQLNLSHNCLSGNIQPSLRNLTNLESLDLSSNFLSGRIPTQLVDLTFLQVFRVSYNQLEGPIPEGKQFNTFDNSSYEGNMGLCGFPLQKQCNDGERQQPAPLEEEDSKSENGFGWKAVLIGYAYGLVFGLTMGYLMFKTREPMWFVRIVWILIDSKGKRLNKNTHKFYGRRN
uniref:LRR-RLK n=1 Tax=Vernicia fordii TaxID=73154 RepID=A0A127AUP7_VERFO|nr:LRR-RLK [Vernicia fordii]